MGVEPSPFREDLIPQLEGVKGSADGIANKIRQFMSTPPDDTIPVEFMEALGYVTEWRQCSATLFIPPQIKVKV